MASHVDDFTAESPALVVFKALKIVVLEKGVSCSFSEPHIIIISIELKAHSPLMHVDGDVETRVDIF